MSLSTPPFMKAIEIGDANEVLYHLNNPAIVIPPDQIIVGFRDAVADGKLEVVKAFLQRRSNGFRYIDLSRFDIIALTYAIKNRHDDIVRVLMADNQMDLIGLENLLIEELQDTEINATRKGKLSTLLEELKGSRAYRVATMKNPPQSGGKRKRTRRAKKMRKRRGTRAGRR